MPEIVLHQAGRRQAANLISRGQIDLDSSWSFSAADGDAILGDPPNWTRYGRWHLGRRPDQDRGTKAGWAFPYGKNGKVYRRGVIAAKSRAAQQGYDSIASAANSLLESIDARTEEDAMPQYMKREEFRDWDLSRGGEVPKDPDEIPCVRKFGAAEIVKQDTDPATGMVDIDFVISTETIDRDSDIISVDGWEIAHYLKNPVVLWAHEHRGPPIGRALNVWVENAKLMARDRFTPQEVNPFGHMVYQLVRGGFLKATSVGFKPLEYVFNDDHKGYDIHRQELYEHSIVPVPANPETLVAASAEGISLEPLREWAEKILDADPDSDRVALWLPKETVEEVHAALSSVAVSLTDTGTDSVDPPTETVTADATTVSGETDSATAVEGELTDSAAYDMKIQLDEPGEDVMDLTKEAIQALSEVVKELREALEALPDEIGAAVDERIAAHLESLKATPPDPPEKDAESDEDEIDDEDLQAIVHATAEEIRIRTTGELPE
jgi:HK97 family phage prohead protease